MDQNQNREAPESNGEPISFFSEGAPPPKRRYSLGMLFSLLCIAVLVTVMLTYTLTSAYVRGVYVAELQKKQAQIELLQKTLSDVDGEGDESFGKLRLLSKLFAHSSYYAGTVSAEDRLDAVLKAYAASMGDAYAEYYSEAEYAEILADNVGQHKGIGVNVVQTVLEVDGYEYEAFRIISIFKNSPAESSELRSGDYICGVGKDGGIASIGELGGYTAAMNAIRGEAGTEVKLFVFRESATGYDSMEIGVTRGDYVAESVSYTRLETDATVGIVRIASFDLTTPVQFKAAVDALLRDGVKQFVFDVRNNPGGDLLSIKAVLTYFLSKGDLILCSVDKNGERVNPYYAEAMSWEGDYASCNVAAREIGMYANLDAVVLCNGNTASAAEVFTATMRDYSLCPVVGETTFGKGIMQSFISLSDVSDGLYDGYVKMTTYAYVTQCGIPYHEIGVSPDGEEIPLSEEAKTYGFYFMPQSADNQLQAAVAELKK